jgi:hypothetical protein
MANIPRHLGIIRARHDTNEPFIPDAACNSMFFTSDHALLKYWSNTTLNHLDFLGSTMFPWVDITVGTDTSREAQAAAAIAALRAKFPDSPPLKEFDGLIVLTHPGKVNFDAGATTIEDPDTINPLRVAVFNVMSSDHTFMCHEIGHVLGFVHSFGLDNNSGGPEYGSPYDLMSSATFGGRSIGTGPFYYASPTFAGPAIPAWPNPRTFSKMGPHIARANLHLRFPGALAGRVFEADFPTPGATISVRIAPASAASGFCLLILHPPGEPPNGIGRVYVEYRTVRGWDRGMDPLGPDLDREGVVVHSVVDVPNKGPRIWYRGSIPTVSVDRDVAVASTSLVVSAANATADGVNLSVTAGAARRVEIVRGNHSDDMVGVVGELQNTTTLCGDPVRIGTFATSTFSQLGVRTIGFGGGGEPGITPVMVAWTVGGVPVTETTGKVEVPFGEVSFTVEYTIDPVVFELALTSRGGERFEAAVVVTVTGDGITVTARDIFTAPGWFDGIHPEDEKPVGECLKVIADRFRVIPTPFRRPTPMPPWGTLLLRRQTKQFWLDKTMRLIDDLPALDAETRNALRQFVRLQVQAAPTILDRLAVADIDFSVAEVEITDWLNNPEFTPYPALAEALLRLLDGKSLRRPVFMDVIVFNYEHSPGNPSPRRVEDVDSSVLKAAVVEGFNTRYGKSVSKFRDLLVQ